MRIGNLIPVDLETPSGNARISSRYRHDKKCYRLLVYGDLAAVRWMFPTRVVAATPKSGKAQAEISHPEREISTLADLDAFRKMLLQRWRERIDLGEDDPAIGGLAGGSPSTLGTLIDMYFKVHAGHLRTHTIETYRLWLKKWLAHIPKQTALEAITADQIKIGMGMIAKSTTASSANGCLRTLRVVLNYAVREGYMTNISHQRVKLMKSVPKKILWWSREEVIKVLEAAKADKRHPRDAHLLFSLALYLGIRKAEIDRLRWEDITLDGEFPLVAIRSTEEAQTKSGKSRFIPVNAELKAILLTYREASGWVIRSQNKPGKWLYRFEPDVLFARVVKAAGVPEIRYHDMRHTFASLMLTNGASLFKVSRWLGHGDVRITQEVYAHLAPYDAEIDLLKFGGDIAPKVMVSSEGLAASALPTPPVALKKPAAAKKRRSAQVA